jgi:hypothetical protein
MERTETLIKSLLILLAFILASTAGQDSASEYILLNKAQSASLLNRFQQKLSPDEQMMFKGCVPLLLVNIKETLGDEITTAHRVSFRGETFFLVIDRLPDIFKSSTKLGDTIKISHSDALILSENPDGSGSHQPLLKDEEYVRLLDYKGYVYLSQTKPRGKCGWTNLKPSQWKKAAKKEQDTDHSTVKLSRLEKERIIELIENANKAYQEHFEFFNNKTNKSIIVPKWRYDLSDTSISCSFSGNEKIFIALNSSTEILVHNINNVFLGRPFSAELKEQTIVITIK